MAWTTRRAGGLTVAFLWTAVAPAFAQRAPEPPKQELPRVSRTAVTDEFLEAYERAEAPRLFMYGRVVAVTEGRADALNKSMVPRTLVSTIRARLTHPAIPIIGWDPSGRDEHESAEEFEGLFSGDVHAEEGTLARRLRNEDVDMVVAVLMSELTGRMDGAKYSARLIIRDLNRDMNVGEHPFELKPGRGENMMTTPRLNAYAVELSRKITELIMDAYPPGYSGAAARFVSVSIGGVPSDAVTTIRSTLQATPNVVAVRRVRFSGSGVTMDIQYEGEALDFAEAAAGALSGALGTDVAFTDSRDGRVGFIVFPPQELSTRESLLAGDDSIVVMGRGADPLQREFVAAYQNRGGQSFAVMVNRKAERPEDDRGDADEGSGSGDAGGGRFGSEDEGVFVQVLVDSEIGDDGEARGTRDDGDDDERGIVALSDEQILNRRVMEDNIVRRMKNLGIRMVELDRAWRLLKEQEDFRTDVHEEFELAKLLGQTAQAEVVVSGVGSVLRGDDQSVVSYTFRAYNTGDGEILGTASSSRAISRLIRDLGPVTDDLAAEAVGKLAVQMWASWSPPQHIEVELSNVTSMVEVERIARIFREKLGGQVMDTTPKSFVGGKDEAGVGHFAMTYDCQFEELIRAIGEQADLPVDLDNLHVDPKVLRLRARDRLP